jgi:O-acetyl-ADP-ribose deacetylase (regulator of RNase III)
MAFPSISTGAFGYPLHEAAQVAVATASAAIVSASHVQHARFVLFDVATLRAYTRAVERLHRAGTLSPLNIDKGTL